MNSWLRNLHIVLAVGGGFGGATLTPPLLLAGARDPTPFLYVGIACLVVLYAYGIFAGLRFARDETDRRHLKVFYWLQVPRISSPLLGYQFASGFHATCTLIGSELRLSFHLGSESQLNLAAQDPWGFGLNFFAIVMAVVLWKTSATTQPVAPATSP